MGKCVSFSLAVPGAVLLTRAMNTAISKGLRTHRWVKIDQKLRDELNHCFFLETWDDPLPWRDERHIRISLATDASGSGWGASVFLQETVTTSDYWSDEERAHDIATREALALDKTLLSFSDSLQNAWVDAQVDNMSVVCAWPNGGRSVALNSVVKQLFFTTTKLNISLHLNFVPSRANPADAPSRRLSALDSKLHPALWKIVQKEFGGLNGHSCDLMALDSNTMLDLNGVPLPHFTPFPSPASSGVNFFAQNLRAGLPFLDRPYIFPPLVLVGAVLRFLLTEHQSCTLVTLVTYPKQYWWPCLMKFSSKSLCLAKIGGRNALLVPSDDGWVSCNGIHGELWAFSLNFA